MADPVDPQLPQRLRNTGLIVRAEDAIRRGWWRALTSWLDRSRDEVMRPARESGNTVPPQPTYLPDSSYWEALVRENVIPPVRDAIANPYRLVTDEEMPSDDPFVQRYLQDVTARMRGLPTETYAMITRIVSNGVDEGLSVPDIAKQVQERLTSTGSEFWVNRAITVARTEAVGATNAGAFAGAVRRARDEGDTEATKQWISTLDGRTRPTHVIADRQEVPLLEPFMVGGYPLMFPGDPRANAPQETINCRCSILDVVAGEDIDWTDRQNQGE